MVVRDGDRDRVSEAEAREGVVAVLDKDRDGPVSVVVTVSDCALPENEPVARCDNVRLSEGVGTIVCDPERASGLDAVNPTVQLRDTF